MAATMIETKDEITLITFTERRLLELRLVRQIGQELRAAVSQSPNQKLLLSFRGVTYLTTMMISELVLLNKACHAAGVELRLCDVPPQIMEVFRIVKLHKLIKIKANEEAAIKSFGKQRFVG
jgi:anti-sigma B factor antagonist